MGVEVTVRAPAAIEASERFQDVRRQGAVLLEALARFAPRSADAMTAVRLFQVEAEVVGEGDQASGLYGPATRLALEFFMPVGTVIPPAWEGTRPGTWTPPAWTSVTTERRHVWWIIALMASWGLAGGIVAAAGVADSRAAKRSGGS